MEKVSTTGSSEPAPRIDKSTPRTYEQLGNDRLLGLHEVAEILACCPVTASRIIKESGYGIVLHRRLFILQSSFNKYLKEQEGLAC